MIPGKRPYFKKGTSQTIEVFSDADWASSLTDGRSTSGYCTYVKKFGNMVKQETSCCG